MASRFNDAIQTVENLFNTVSGGNTSGGSNASGGSGVSPFTLLAGIYDTIEVRSNAAPPVKISVNDLGNSGPPSPASQLLQPTIIFSGGAGNYTLAPYGAASPDTGWLTSVGGIGLLIGAGFLLGRLTAKK